MTVYERIDRLLRERGMSRRKLAHQAGINETTLASIFARRPKEFPYKNLLKVSMALGVSCEWLENGSEDEGRTEQSFEAKMIESNKLQIIEMISVLAKRISYKKVIEILRIANEFYEQEEEMADTQIGADIHGGRRDVET